MAYRLLPEAADAEDVLQDVFIGLPGARQRFDRDRPVEAVVEASDGVCGDQPAPVEQAPRASRE